MTSDIITYASVYPIVLGHEGVSEQISHDAVDGLLGAETFSVNFDITARSPGESGELFRLGSSLVASVDDAGEIVLQAATDTGMVDLRTTGANMADAAPHAVEIDYSDGQLSVIVDGERTGTVEMPPLVAKGGTDTDFQLGDPRGEDNFASKIGTLTISATDMTPDGGTGADDGPDQAVPPDDDDAPDDGGTVDNPPDLPAGDVVRVSTQSDLYDALSRAEGGEKILLDGGDYGDFRLTVQSGFDYTYASEVTIASADASNPAIFSGLDIRGAENIGFDGVVFDYDYGSGDARFIRPFVVNGGENIAIRNATFDGDLARGVSSVADGHGWGTGLSVRNATGVTIEGTEFFEFWKGAVLNGIDDLVVRDNDIHSMRMDGLNFAKVQNASIENNHIHDFDTAESSGDHADMIQFWTNGADRPSTDVVIRGNTLDIGAGDWTQSIFMRNDMVDRGLAGKEMFYRDLTIEDNVIVNGHRHGITVGETDGLTIRGNSVLHADGRDADGTDAPVEIPWINVSARSRDVTIADNLVSRISADTGTVTGNVLVQDQDPNAPGYYGDVFLSSSLQADDGAHLFVARPGGLADLANAGASETLVPSEGLRPGFHIATVDEDASARIFDASHTLLDGNPVGDEARFEWSFSNGSTVTDRVFAAVFEGGGQESVTLKVTLPDGASRNVSHDFEVTGPELLRFESGTGLIVDGDEEIDLSGLGTDGVRLGSSGAKAEIPRDHVVEMVGTDEFSLDFTLAGEPGDSGTIFRLGSAFIGTVRGDGDILIRAATEDGRLRFETSGPAVNDGAAHEVEIDLLDGILQVAIDGEAAGRTDMGPISDGSSHGLYLGNPWGGNFDGLLSDVEITVDASDFDTTDVGGIPGLAAFDPVLMT